MSNTPPAVTAIMPARDDAAHMTAAVSSVLSQDYPGVLDVVIGLAPSADDSAAVAATLALDPRVHVVANPAGGTAAGLNQALEASTGTVIVRVDAHCELPPGYVARAVETMERTRAANVGGVQAAEGEASYQRAVARAMSSVFGVGDAKFHYGGDEGPADTVYLGVFDAETLRSVGAFDESLVRNQDYELNWRLRDAGHLIFFDPELVVRYRPRSSARRLASQYFQYGQWKREVVRRHPRSAKPRQLIAPATVVAIVAATIGAASGHRWMLAAPVTYAAAVLAASAHEASSLEEAAALAGIFPTMHLTWGAGFLVGPPKSARQVSTHTETGPLP
jgi:succinoglycan biosynthesis protein ExoA